MSKHNKYIVFIDYGVEGWSIWGSYDTLDEAVIEASRNNYGKEFLIVTKVVWEATEKQDE